MVDDLAGYCGRGVTVITVILAIVLSFIASSDCRFLKFQNDSEEPWRGLEAPFDGALEGNVGVFSYEILDATDASRITDGCVKYDSGFGKTNFEAVTAAQFCAVFAPALGVLGILINLVDTLLCRFFLSFLFSALLFLGASGVQAGAFSLFAEPDFCFDGGQYCDVGISVFLAGASSVLFFLACVILCCVPTPDPLLSRRKPKQAKSGDQNGDYDEDYEDDSDGEPKKPSNKISDDEFDFEVPQTKDRVEFRERTLRDGRRQVDKITIREDGSKTVTTETYGS